MKELGYDAILYIWSGLFAPAFMSFLEYDARRLEVAVQRIGKVAEN